MQHFCKYNPKSKRCAVWFNKVCTQCREQFPKKDANQVSGESENSLITAEECYSSIKRSAESEQVNNFFQNDIWWKVPIVLLICGSILVILISFCFICQRIVSNLQSQVPPSVDIDVCERESNVPKRRSQCCVSEPTDRRSSSACRSKSSNPRRSLHY